MKHRAARIACPGRGVLGGHLLAIGRGWWLVAGILVCAATAAFGADRAIPKAAMPEEVGIQGAALRALDEDIVKGKYGFVDSLLVARCGRVAFERFYEHDYVAAYGERAGHKGPMNAHGSGPYDYFDARFHPYFQGSRLHSLQSVTKTITALIIGIAITRGDFHAPLSRPVLDYFQSVPVRNADERKARMTLEHLLTMTSGLDWNEDAPYQSGQNTAVALESAADWIQFAIDRPMAAEPGAVFAYSSGVSELLAHVFVRETGRDIEDYARQALFEPLDIREEHWKKTPTGLTDTEGGLYLRSEDLAKIGLLLLGDGSWKGRRIVSAEWIRNMVSPHVDTGADYRYGFQIWLRPGGSPGGWIWSARGFGGQYLLVVPDRELVLVATGWNILERSAIEREALDRVRAATSPGACRRQ